jgi:hypothetical protein
MTLPRSDVPRGTLDLMVLETLDTLSPSNGSPRRPPPPRCARSEEWPI